MLCDPLGQMQQFFQSGEYDRAFEIAIKLAPCGHVNAQEIAGNGYQMGWAGQWDEAKAAYWYEQAIAQGSGLAANNLSGMVQCGYADHPPDPERAMTLFDQARSLGFEHAPKELLC